MPDPRQAIQQQLLLKQRLITVSTLTVYTRTECSLRVRGSSKSFATAMTL